MIISVFNCSSGAIDDAKMQRVIRAINLQIERDFEPYWSFGATLRLEGHTQRRGRNGRPYQLLDMRGDAVLYVWDKFNKDYAGFHNKTLRGIPYGTVFLDISQQLNEDWTVTLSHEALELIGDPETNLTVQGPHPTDAKRDVFHWFEMCDAVQSQSYEIDSIGVSDFVLPLYFTRGTEPGSRNNFLGAYKGAAPLKSFETTAGGYIGYFDPQLQSNATYELAKDKLALARQAIKRSLNQGRRVLRQARANFGVKAKGNVKK